MFTTTTTAANGQRWRSMVAGLQERDVVVPILVLLQCVWIFSTPLHFPEPIQGLAQDDFYYYLKAAQNLAWWHRAEVFPHVPTNGYHPLYFLLLTALSIFVHSLRGVYRFLWALDTVSAMTIFFCTRRIFASLSSKLLANVLAIQVTVLSIIQICHQMEVTLALPIGFAFLAVGFKAPGQISTRRAAILGLLGALTVLARLDAGLLVLLYLAGWLIESEYRRALNRASVAAFSMAFLPLPLLYLWINHRFFHTLLPVSGMAKELRHGHAPSFLLFRTFLNTDLVLACGTVLGLVLGFAFRKHLSGRERIFLFTVLAEPILFYGTEMWVSDWPVWPWYFYVLRFAASGLAVLFCVLVRQLSRQRWPEGLRSFAQSPLAAGLLLCVAMLKLRHTGYFVDPYMLETQRAAATLDRFAETHPGAYAMGDRAGMFLSTSPRPVLQVEGLVMDEAYLQHMRRQEDLQSVLALYGVRYYVAFVPKRSYEQAFSDGCFHAKEPFLAGPMAMHMRSDFCGAPAYQFSGFDGTYVIYPVKSPQALTLQASSGSVD